MPPVTMRELRSETEIEGAFGVMSELRDRIRRETFGSEVRRQQVEGYRLIGAFDGDRLVGLAGVRRSHTLARGEHLFVDDLVTTATARGLGVGTALLAWLAVRAREENLDRIYLESRDTARGFYERLGFTFRTSIPCWIDADALLSGDARPGPGSAHSGR
jgi:GNAT superfamily N-acetyltransferase